MSFKSYASIVIVAILTIWWQALPSISWCCMYDCYSTSNSVQFKVQFNRHQHPACTALHYWPWERPDRLLSKPCSFDLWIVTMIHVFCSSISLGSLTRLWSHYMYVLLFICSYWHGYWLMISPCRFIKLYAFSVLPGLEQQPGYLVPLCVRFEHAERNGVCQWINIPLSNILNGPSFFVTIRLTVISMPSKGYLMWGPIIKEGKIIWRCSACWLISPCSLIKLNAF